MPGGEGHIAEIQGQAGVSAENERHQGFDEAVAANGKAEAVSSQIGWLGYHPGHGDHGIHLIPFPKVEVMFCANDNAAVEAVQAYGRKWREISLS